MNDIKPMDHSGQVDTSEAPVQPAKTDSGRELGELPISNWDDYKSWCEKVKENWDVN